MNTYVPSSTGPSVKETEAETQHARVRRQLERRKLDKWIHLYTENDKPMYKRANMSTGSGTPWPTINWLPGWKRVSKWKRVQKKAVDSIFNVHQPLTFIIFIISKVAGEYKTISKDFI